MSVSNPSSTPSEDKTAALRDILDKLDTDFHDYHNGRWDFNGPKPTEIAEQAIRNWAIAQLPEKMIAYKTDGTADYWYAYGNNQAITTATTNLKGDDHAA
jgi:hypothetical protein